MLGGEGVLNLLYFVVLLFVFLFLLFVVIFFFFFLFFLNGSPSGAAEDLRVMQATFKCYLQVVLCTMGRSQKKKKKKTGTAYGARFGKQFPPNPPATALWSARGSVRLAAPASGSVRAQGLALTLDCDSKGNSRLAPPRHNTPGKSGGPVDAQPSQHVGLRLAMQENTVPEVKMCPAP